MNFVIFPEPGNKQWGSLYSGSKNEKQKIKERKTDSKYVYQVLQERLKHIFWGYNYVYPSFSGGQDNGMPLNACVKHVRQYGGRMEVLHMDYEVQHSLTTEYVERFYFEQWCSGCLLLLRSFQGQLGCIHIPEILRALESLYTFGQEDMGGYLGTEVFDFYTSQMWEYKF